MLFALCSVTPLVTQRDLYFMAGALELQASIVARAWGLEAPAVMVCASPDSLRSFCQPIICTDKDEADTNFDAYHQPDKFHGTLSRVFAPRATGIFTGDTSTSELVSHELFEALVDPLCDLYTHMPGRAANVDTALEASDMLQNTYVVTHMGTDVQCANFLYRAAFDDSLADPERASAFMAAGGKFDHLGTLTRAGQIGPEGYAVLRDGSRRWLESFTGPMGANPNAGAAHPAARTGRRLLAA